VELTQNFGPINPMADSKNAIHKLSLHWGRTRFLLPENLRKIMKVSHFLLLFSVGENTNESKHFYTYLFGFLGFENPEQTMRKFC